jgi:seryl-tRNA synthetase
MAAECAVCRKAILRNDRFVLDGTEAFHPYCLQDRYRSALRVAQQHQTELQKQLDATRRAAARIEEDERRARNEASQRHAAQIRLESQAATLRDELARSQERLRAVEGALAAARNEGATLRAEVAKVRQETVPAEDTKNDIVDASSVRFGLLELD